MEVPGKCRALEGRKDGVQVSRSIHTGAWLQTSQGDRVHARPRFITTGLDYVSRFLVSRVVEEKGMGDHAILIKAEKMVQQSVKSPRKTVDVAVLPTVNRVTLRAPKDEKALIRTYPDPSATIFVLTGKKFGRSYILEGVLLQSRANQHNSG